MTVTTPLLTRRAVMQCAVESTYNTPATITNADGLLVSQPEYQIQPNVLKRDFVQFDLSMQPHIIGRKLAKMTFRTELRSNGKTNSGLIGDAPMISRLFRACGYALSASTDVTALGPFDKGDHANPVAWTVDTTGATAITTVKMYHVKVTTGGISGTAQITVTSDEAGEGASANSITTATPETLGTSGVTITPVFTGSLAQGQAWHIWVLPPGLTLTPVSDNFESVTLDMNKDGVRHRMPGSFGTFTLEATAGQYGAINWEFTGTYVAPTDVALPSATYEKTLPAQVEKGRLRLDDFYAIVEKVTFDQKNDIQIRPDVSSVEGYIGTRIVGRAPEGGIDPEAELVANNDFWNKMGTADRMAFQFRAGSTPGNEVWMLAPVVQYTGLTYKDRQGILTYDAGIAFARYQGNDEVFWHFC